LSRSALLRVCEAWGLIGGCALLGTMLTMIATVVGAAFGKPVLGDSEIVELLGGISVFAFLPYCHLRGANVFVDFFTRPLPAKAKAWLDAAMNLIFAAVAVLLTWRLVEGGLLAYERSKRSMFLQLPDSGGYAIGALSMVLWVVVCLFVAWESTQRARGRIAAPAEASAGFG
jgi:TRAP-type C4-dicarboxylate transport system permease small subunit